MKPGKQIKNGTKAFRKCCHDSTEVSIRKFGSLISDFPSFFVISFCVAIAECRLKHCVTNRRHWMMTKTKQIANENAKTDEREEEKEKKTDTESHSVQCAQSDSKEMSNLSFRWMENIFFSVLYLIRSDENAAAKIWMR